MPDAAQYSFGLFDSTAPGWSVETPTSITPEALDPHDEDDTDVAANANPVATPMGLGENFYLASDRALARGWPARARDNVASIRLSKELEEAGRAPTHDEQETLLRFIGFGASELAQNCFPLPGADTFRTGWDEIGSDLATVTSPSEYAALQRATQYAHYTPEPVIRSLWRAAQHLGFAGGRVLEPGMGTGLFFALLPEALRSTTRLTGVEYDPITARIARLIHPTAHVRCEDYARSPIGGGFDLTIGNPPFADRIVRADPTTAALGLRLDYMLKCWDTFSRFVDDGRICLSNKAAERALPGVALGRKAWLFCGSDRGGERAAAVYTLIVTAKLNGVALRAWLADVLRRIADHPASRLHELLPWNWNPPTQTAATA